MKHWVIESGGQLVVANKAQAIHYEMTKEELEKCQLISRTYYCRQLVQQKTGATQTCLMAIYRSELHLIYKLCRIQTQTVPEVAVPLNKFQLMIYTERQTVYLSCMKGKIKKRLDRSIQGLVLISFPQNISCEFASNRYQLKTFPYLETSVEPSTIHIDVPIEKLLNVTREELHTPLESFEKRSTHEFNLQDAKKELEKIEYRSTSRTRSIIGFAIIAAVVTGLVLLLLTIGLYKRYERGPINAGYSIHFSREGAVMDDHAHSDKKNWRKSPKVQFHRVKTTSTWNPPAGEVDEYSLEESLETTATETGSKNSEETRLN